MGMPPHGRALWNGDVDLPAHTEVRSILTGDKLLPVATVGCVILPDAMNNAASPGRHGMVYAIDHDQETGEAVYHVLTHRNIRGRIEAWTFSMPASELDDPHRIVADRDTARHGYAKAALLSAAGGRGITQDQFDTAHIGLRLIQGCIWGRK